MYSDVKDKIIEFGEQCSVKPVAMKCEHCEKDFDVPITFDQSNFFA